MAIKNNLQAGIKKPAFVGWTIFQIEFGESLIRDLVASFGQTSEISALLHEIPKGEGDQHRAKRSFEDWRKDICENFKI